MNWNKALVKICIVDYGFGNIWSLKNAVDFLGFDCKVSSDPRDVLGADKILLPGVGASNSAMAALEERNLKKAIVDAVSIEGNKILGICLGMQIMAEIGNEDGFTNGLGLIKGEITLMKSTDGLKVPHIGFNEVTTHTRSKLFQDLPDKSDFYFVHSYQLLTPPQDGISAFSTYGETFVSAFEAGNVFATQFHPEKSQSNGLKVLRNFLELPHA